MIVSPPQYLFDNADISRRFSLWGAIILECIWTSRNEVVHGKVMPNPTQCLLSYSKRVEEFEWCLPSEQLDRKSENYCFPISWTPPKSGTIKINVDASVSEHVAAVSVVC
ncbi:hypothetical protein TorRG33x02_270940 [Trema orientale]|uniref:Uncharacterized protein n=1 Tax=Trema orientale TaxID=63057 RepID=A0A2P5CW99_TREOI|nr:hypothetical protein TorRG33x02_270940 [Trema orientale]